MNRRLSLSIGLANRFRETSIDALKPFEKAVERFYGELYDYSDTDLIYRLNDLVELFEKQVALIPRRPDLDAAVEYYRAGLTAVTADAKLRWTREPMLRDAVTDVEDALRTVARRIPKGHTDAAAALNRNADVLDRLSGAEEIDSKLIAKVLKEAAELTETVWADEKYVVKLTEALTHLEVQYLLREDA